MTGTHAELGASGWDLWTTMSSGIRPEEDGTWLFWASSGITVKFDTRLEALKAWHEYHKGEPGLQSLVQDMIVEEEDQDD